MKKRRLLATGIGLVVSAVFLFLAFRDLKPEDFVRGLGQVQAQWLVVGAVVYFAAVAVIAMRWQFLLRAVAWVPWPSLIALVTIGYMGNNVYPLRAGEGLRIFLLNRYHHVPIPRSTTIVIVERMLDGLVMLTFIVIALPQAVAPASAIYNVATFAGPIFVSALVIFLFLAAKPNVLRVVVGRVTGFMPNRLRPLITHLSDELLHGLEALRNPFYFWGAVITSFVTWGIEAGVYWLVAIGFGLDLPYIAILLVVGTVNLAGILPSSPGQIGVYEFFVGASLVALGVSPLIAPIYAVVVHVVIWLPVTAVGFLLLAYLGLWEGIGQASEQPPPRDA